MESIDFNADVPSHSLTSLEKWVDLLNAESHFPVSENIQVWLVNGEIDFKIFVLCGGESDDVRIRFCRTV